jgi:hypothetical protein
VRSDRCGTATVQASVACVGCFTSQRCPRGPPTAMRSIACLRLLDPRTALARLHRRSVAAARRRLCAVRTATATATAVLNAAQAWEYTAKRSGLIPPLQCAGLRLRPKVRTVLIRTTAARRRVPRPPARSAPVRSTTPCLFATEWRLWYSLVCGALRYNAPSALCLMVRLTFEIHRGGKVGPYGCRRV